MKALKGDGVHPQPPARLMTPVLRGDTVRPSLDTGKLKEYVLSRQNEDGGFAICKPLPSSLAETFYAVQILKTMKWEVPKRDKLVQFLKANLRKEVYSIFYVFYVLRALDCEIPKKYCDFLLERLDDVLIRGSSGHLSNGDLSSGGITATYSFELPNILREVYCIATTLEVCGKELPEKVKKFVAKFRKNGGYGVKDANLKETFYSISVLKIKDVRIANFVRRFRCSKGGYAKKPGSYPPYIEETYYALSILHKMRAIELDEATIEYLLSLQNPDGGFRRSPYLGISSLENTFYAVKSLEYLRYL